jgi:hypothetical protein
MTPVQQYYYTETRRVSRMQYFYYSLFIFAPWKLVLSLPGLSASALQVPFVFLPPLLVFGTWQVDSTKQLGTYHQR